VSDRAACLLRGPIALAAAAAERVRPFHIASIVILVG
jgi:hypothetical protein